MLTTQGVQGACGEPYGRTPGQAGRRRVRGQFREKRRPDPGRYQFAIGAFREPYRRIATVMGWDQKDAKL